MKKKRRILHGFIKFTAISILILTLAALIHVVHAETLDKIIEYKEIAFRSRDVGPELSGYRIGFVSDTHMMTDDRLAEAMDELNGRRLDLLALGGDYRTSLRLHSRTMEIISKASAADGIYGVEGNHDFGDLSRAMASHSITKLSNAGQYVRGNLFIAGVEDLMNGRPDVTKSLKGSTPEDFALLLSHNPDVAMLQNTSGADLILSGHTHGGQVTCFGIWAPYFTISKTITGYGQRFRSGWARSANGVPVYVSNGAGEYLIRVFARPQIIIITLLPETGKS